MLVVGEDRRGFSWQSQTLVVVAGGILMAVADGSHGRPRHWLLGRERPDSHGNSRYWLWRGEAGVLMAVPDAGCGGGEGVGSRKSPRHGCGGRYS